MKVYASPLPASLSKAMYRVAAALVQYAPSHIRFVQTPKEADLQIMHVISMESMELLRAPKYAVIQYCLASANGDHSAWSNVWNNATLVWSYYDLRAPRFYRGPLGGDEAFARYQINGTKRDITCFTSGYVTGPGAEAIAEVANAASKRGLSSFHLGPVPVGMTRIPKGWMHLQGIEDREVARYYARSKWVSGLRYVEGFELPVVEGLMCGARPICFDRGDMRKWYSDHAVFVPEKSGEELEAILEEVFSKEPKPVGEVELAKVRETFSWSRIVPEFWSGVLGNV